MWGPGGRAPGSSGVLGDKLLSDEHAFIPYCDTGRSRICVGSRGGAPGNSGVLGNKLLSDEHAFIPYLVTLVGRELAWGPRRSPRKFRGFGQ